MKKIYIVLSMSGTKFSRFLRLFSGLDYTHVSLSLHEDLTEMYSFGRQNLTRPWIAGFVVEEANKGVYAKYNSKCEVLSFDVEDDIYYKLHEEIQSVKENIELYKYNFIGLLFAYLKIERKLHTRFTCVQFVAWQLEDVGLELWDKDVSLVYPDDFYEIPNIRKTYEGYINSYEGCA